MAAVARSTVTGRRTADRLAVVTAALSLLLGSAALAETTAIPGEPTARIIGGQVSRPGDFPSVVALLRNQGNRNQSLRQFCGGSLIAPTWVLTAAHCVVDRGTGETMAADALTALVGQTRLSTANDGNRVGEVAVLNVIPHPSYDPIIHAHDIALLELSQAVDLPIVGLHAGTEADIVGGSAFAVGWGVVDNSDPNNPAFDVDQRHVGVPVVSNAVCNGSASYDGDVYWTHFCAGIPEGGIDSCQGDSGGPLIMGIRGIQVQVGVVSWGYGCALPDLYGAYTNVALQRDWISSYVDAVYVSSADVSAPVEPIPNQQPVNDGQPERPVLSGQASGTGGGGGAMFGLLAAMTGVLSINGRRRMDR